MWAEVIVVSVVAPVAFAAAQAFLRGYATRKGEGLATIEDLHLVSRRVEALQATFAASVARVASVRGHRFSTELAIYRELWEKVVDLQQAADKVWHDGLLNGANSSAYPDFRSTLEAFHDKIQRLRPFFPSELSGPLLAAQLPIREVAARTAGGAFASTEEMSKYLEASWPKISAGLADLEAAIRGHLEVDERLLSTMTSG